MHCHYSKTCNSLSNCRVSVGFTSSITYCIVLIYSQQQAISLLLLLKRAGYSPRLSSIVYGILKLWQTAPKQQIAKSPGPQER